MRILLITLIGIVLLSSCGSQTRKGRVQSEVKTTLTVENRNWNDMRIYIQRKSGQRINLGSVRGLSSRNFNIPESLFFGNTALKLIADPIGVSKGLSVSHEVNVSPGEDILMVIPIK